MDDVDIVPDEKVRHIASSLAEQSDSFRRWIDSVGPSVVRSVPAAVKRQARWSALFGRFL